MEHTETYGMYNDAHTSAFTMVQISSAFGKAGFTCGQRGAADKARSEIPN